MVKEEEMATIKVKSKVENTIHPKYGPLKKGQILEIDEKDFGDQIFEKIDKKDKKKGE